MKGLRKWRRHCLAALAAALVSSVLVFSTTNAPDPAGGDAHEYLAAAFHLRHHGIFSESRNAAMPRPAVGREPGYAAVLAALMVAGTRLDDFVPACFERGSGCGQQIYRSALAANAVFFAATGLLVFVTLRVLGVTPLGCWIGGFEIWLNDTASKGREGLVSDHFALFLAALLALSLAWAARRQRSLAWAVPGAVLAALTLTKAVFLYLAVAGIAGAAVVIAARAAQRQPTRKLLSAWIIFSVTFLTPVGGWMARNHAVDGRWMVSSGRTAVVLHNRVVLNEMTLAQYGAAFVYWIRGSGDSMAKRWFAPESWQPLELDRPGGFYDRGQHGLEPRLAAMTAAESIDRATAEARLVVEQEQAIIDNLPKHLAVTVPLMFRGIWVDEFILITLPALLWLLVRSLAARRWVTLLVLVPGLFSMVFYPLVSLNVPRYQLVAVPTFALALGYAAAALAEWRRNHRVRRS